MLWRFRTGPALEWTRCQVLACRFRLLRLQRKVREDGRKSNVRLRPGRTAYVHASAFQAPYATYYAFPKLFSQDPSDNMAKNSPGLLTLRTNRGSSCTVTVSRRLPPSIVVGIDLARRQAKQFFITA